MFKHFGFIGPKNFKIIWFSKLSTLRVPDEGDSLRVPDEGVPDEGDSLRVPDEDDSLRVPDEDDSRNTLCVLRFNRLNWDI